MTVISFQDSVSGNALPPTQEYGVFYANGTYANYSEVRVRLPKAKLLGITVSYGYGVSANVPIADCETGDFTVSEVIAWVEDMLRINAPLIVVYANGSTWNEGLRAALAKYGNRIRRWIAQYDNIPQIPAGFDGKQYEGNVNGGFGDVDKNVVIPDFFQGFEPHLTPEEERALKGHYGRFTKYERSLVNTYDIIRAEQTATRHPGKVRLNITRAQLKVQAGKVWAISHAQRVKGRPSWGESFRGWRYAQLSDRAAGKRLL
jgi:hypothetical protein